MSNLYYIRKCPIKCYTDGNYYLYAIYYYNKAASILLRKTLRSNVLLEKNFIADLFFKIKTRVVGFFTFILLLRIL